MAGPAPPLAPPPEDFYDLVARLTAHYERQRARCLHLEQLQPPPERASVVSVGSEPSAPERSRSLISDQSELSVLQLWTQHRPKRRISDAVPRMRSASSFASGTEDTALREGLRSGDVLYEPLGAVERMDRDSGRAGFSR